VPVTADVFVVVCCLLKVTVNSKMLVRWPVPILKTHFAQIIRSPRVWFDLRSVENLHFCSNPAWRTLVSSTRTLLRLIVPLQTTNCHVWSKHWSSTLTWPKQSHKLTVCRHNVCFLRRSTYTEFPDQGCEILRSTSDFKFL
jgi:hypothetical protein